ncbi:MAG: hypothetical protein CL610_30285 [Anaerolineaceae bacterium]|nr:hypothetical protein [Anaerolineaceae bacterium]
MEDTSMTVLLVDDDPHACAIFELVMNHHHLPLEVAGDAEAALDYLQRGSPDMIVLDLFLPGLDGYQVLDRIRETSLEADCPIVATTAYYTNDTRQEVLNRGFDGFLPKPFEADNLVSFLRQIRSRGR